ncbi:hypothetical protein ACE1ET_20010 [Saccharicrinis sp. FJH62]|uniref:hypothetical protein n=1 Tax=Saccharicrinis sp. FJH62 TaxID=3344657 RepID=UPI0035D3DDCA
MKLVILFLVISFSIDIYSQNITDINIEDLQNKQAKFIGGNDALQNFFIQNMRYPLEMDYGTMIGIIIIDQKMRLLKPLR